ncbi:unnamed protein product [Gulo gulo]|uniref:Uncharacterized protein n=1 Tax=Gulo gulo TaxID=48420 RepID=A0A9X9MCD8_GULGU|nr:unnamed protein product [Gulo gulo]
MTPAYCVHKGKENAAGDCHFHLLPQHLLLESADLCVI